MSDCEAGAQPLVSVIVTTRNEEPVIGNVLRSVNQQTYRPIETIVVDNHSEDGTARIARELGAAVYIAGPERSAQRNHGVQVAHGTYVLVLDADMELSPNVVAACVAAMQQDPLVKAVIVPEESFGTGYWAAVKALERSCYAGDDLVEAARFFDRQMFLGVGGFDQSITGPEDWDMSQRVRAHHRVARINAVIRHNEGRLSLVRSARKKYYYGRSYRDYLRKHPGVSLAQANMVLRPAYFRSWRRLVRDPVHTAGLIVMRIVEFSAAAMGFARGLMD